MYKIAVFADIHANYNALSVIIDDINKHSYDRVICLGDILSKGPSPRECMDAIIDNNIEMVFGNHEGKAQELWLGLVERLPERGGNLFWCMEQMDERCKEYILKLGYDIKVNVDGVSLQFTHYPFDHKNKKFFPHCHMTKGIAKRYFKEYDYDYIFYGHYHYGNYVNLDGKKLYNLDSSGCVEDDTTFYYIVTINDGKVSVRKKKLKYDRNKLIEKIKKSDTPNKEHLAETFFGINL